MKTKILGVLVLMLAVWSCATTRFMKEPSEKTKTLLIGQIELRASGEGRPGAAVSVDGHHLRGIEIELQDLKTGKKLTIRSKNKGFFYIVNPPARLELIQIKYEARQGGSWASCWKTFGRGGRNKIQIIEGKVNNIGWIQWLRDGKSRIYKCTMAVNHGSVKSKFRETFPKSGWNNYEWKTVTYIYH